MLAVEVSRTTMLRLARALPVPEPGTITVVGVDDFAFRKGNTYGQLSSTWTPADPSTCCPIVTATPSPPGCALTLVLR
ncbi:hypothetical protein [Paractinoplanes hotanensis]|uniref:Transposase n=1 Tax=Paractinoplanes hotanensis TaxID=2906497 RepID=A0ABT0XY60_9ACTN|nr:hypothetical protein [Actinoplanes hotanensis]MCM4078718.1 hypothetical protein [Actinoplanes hotanensis]